jgi:hypothetical protein
LPTLASRECDLIQPPAACLNYIQSQTSSLNVNRAVALRLWRNWSARRQLKKPTTTLRNPPKGAVRRPSSRGTSDPLTPAKIMSRSPRHLARRVIPRHEGPSTRNPLIQAQAPSRSARHPEARGAPSSQVKTSSRSARHPEARGTPLLPSTISKSKPTSTLSTPPKPAHPSFHRRGLAVTPIPNTARSCAAGYPYIAPTAL